MIYLYAINVAMITPLTNKTIFIIKYNMEKQINEQFLKMQKLAGVITESQYISEINEMSVGDDLQMEKAWKATPEEEKIDILVPYTDDGDVEPFLNLSIGEMPSDMSKAVKDFLNEPFSAGNPNAYTDDIYNYGGEMDDMGFDDDDTFYESKKPKNKKMSKTELKEAIRKEIMAALTEDGIDLEEAKKDEEEEEVTLDAEETETEDTADDSMGDGNGSTDEVQQDLTAALNSAKQLGDKKLVRQIGNALTYFTRQQISTEEI